MLRKIPNKRSERGLVEALAHPVKRRAEVIHEFLARVGGADFVCERGCLFDIGVARLNPEEVGVGPEFLGALGCSGEAGAVVVETFPGTGNVAGPGHGGFGVVIGEGSAAGDGEVGVLGDVGFVGVAGGVGGAFGLEVGVDG